MTRYFFTSLLVMSGLLCFQTQLGSDQTDLPSVSVSLPEDVPSETVQISYFLTGPFGGNGGHTDQQPGLHSYEISTAIGGKAASEIKLIVYASGCEIDTFTFSLAPHSKVKQAFECHRAATVHLSGKIVPASLVAGADKELVVNYIALWSSTFFGIADGPVTEFQLATVALDSHGAFEVDLPYFAADIAEVPFQRNAGFHLMLRDSKTLNSIAYILIPTASDLRLEEPALQILPRYPDVVEFTPQI